MSRTLLSNLAVWTMLLGWIVADPDLHASGRLFAMYVAVLALNGAGFIVNDILDAPSDAITSPHLPLPSGLVTVRQAWAAVAGCLLVTLVAVYAAAEDLSRFCVSLALLVFGIALLMLYSKIKDLGVVASVVVTIPQSVPAVTAWVAAGGGSARWFGLALTYCLLAGASNNILAALRDVDRDEEAGNRTLAVRVGAPWAFRWAALLGAAALVPVVVLAVDAPHGRWVVPFSAVAVVVLWVGYRGAIRLLAEPGRGRSRRLHDMRVYKLGEYVRHSAVVAAFNPLAALIAGVYLISCLRIGYRVYNRRLVSGAIRRSLERTAYAGARQ